MIEKIDISKTIAVAALIFASAWVIIERGISEGAFLLFFGFFVTIIILFAGKSKGKKK